MKYLEATKLFYRVTGTKYRRHDGRYTVYPPEDARTWRVNDKDGFTVMASAGPASFRTIEGAIVYAAKLA